MNHCQLTRSYMWCAPVLTLSLCLSTSLAQTTAVSSGNWSDAGVTWDNGEPSATTPASIDGGLIVTIDQAGEATSQLNLGTIDGETGRLTMSGGDLLVDGDGLTSIRIGQAANATGELTMTGGAIDIRGVSPSNFAIGDLLIGDVGTGTMTLSGGTVDVADEVFVGLGAGSSGQLDVSGGVLNVNGRNLLVGFSPNSHGGLSLAGSGEVNVDEFVFTSFADNASSTLQQTGGQLNVGFAFVHGRRGNASFEHSGGSITVSSATGNGDFVVGDGGPNNTYNISGDATVSAERNLLVGVFGDAVGTVTQTGGDIDVGGLLRVGIDGLGSWDQSGGTLNVAGSAWLGDFDSSLGEFKLSGGRLSITGNLSVGAALASNAPPMPMNTQGQALDADGALTISGSGGTITIGGNLLANPAENLRVGGGGEHNDSAINFEVLDDTGVSVIDVAGVANLAGAVINIDLLGGQWSPGQSIDLLTATSITNNFTQIPEDLGAFALSVVSGGNGQILRATLVPELSALAGVLLGLATGSLVCRRKVR